MANEPERPIEELLRDAARKRRDEAGAPFELHPATRRLLQGEVARQLARPQREARSFASLVAQLWPRFAWGLGLLAVLGVAVWVLFPGMHGEKPETFLARKLPVSEVMPPQAAPPTQSDALRYGGVSEAVPPQATLPPSPSTFSASPALPKEPQPMKPTAEAFADKAESEPDGSARQIGNERRLLAKDSFREAARSKAVGEALPATAAEKADRKRAAEWEMAAAGGAMTQSPAGTVNGRDERRYGLATRASPLATAVAAASAPAPAVTASAPVSAPTVAEESIKLSNDWSGQTAMARQSFAEPAAADRLRFSATSTDEMAKSADASLKEAKSIRLTQRFARVIAGTKAKAAAADDATSAHPVLASFQVEQRGSELRIVDADGSVYRGYVQVTDNGRRERAVRLETPAASSTARASKGALEGQLAPRLDSDQVTPQGYSFRVTGTNLSLRQNVVFSGNLLLATRAASPPPGTAGLSVGTGLGSLQNRSAQLPPLPLPNSRISGKVVVGNGKPVEINAEPASP